MPTKAKPKAETKKPEVKVIKKAKPELKPEPKVSPQAHTPTKAKPKAKVVPKVEVVPVPEYGKKYIFTSNGGEFIGSLSKGDPFDKMTIYAVQNGVITDRTIDVPDVSVYTFVDDKAEIAQRLG